MLADAEDSGSAAHEDDEDTPKGVQKYRRPSGRPHRRQEPSDRCSAHCGRRVVRFAPNDESEDYLQGQRNQGDREHDPKGPPASRLRRRWDLGHQTTRTAPSRYLTLYRRGSVRLQNLPRSTNSAAGETTFIIRMRYVYVYATRRLNYASEVLCRIPFCLPYACC